MSNSWVLVAESRRAKDYNKNSIHKSAEEIHQCL
jgi:hypothetical protein